MATTVDSAFSEFMKDIVNLDPAQSDKAKSSRDNLIANIQSFSGDTDFFRTYNSKFLNYGSFAKHTKIRPLDDIDLMICISANDRTFSYHGLGTYYMTANQSDIDNGLNMDGTRRLNSTKVINRFISKLADLSDYKKSEMHKNHEAATLKLKSYDWNFDIVPCFHCNGDFYLIPDGYGNWKKTDPRIDNNRVTELNVEFNSNLLPLVRLVKYWNKYNATYTLGSYLLESMILNRYEMMSNSQNWWIDMEFRDTLEYLSSAILQNIEDPKHIQGNINQYNFYERKSISQAMKRAYEKACVAVSLDVGDGDQKASTNKWKEILGDSFPSYTGA